MPKTDIHILGSDPAFLDLMDKVSVAAALNRPVLVIGERGTGKELIAARLHYLSRRWDQAFIKLNCAALPETLVDSELFGVEPGAFTGAVRRRAGRFEQADGGSLFLDEIATLSMAAQEKLLRIIEYGEFERLGGTDTLSVDVRIIGATNVDLPALADEGRFRADLLDRLAFDVLTVPPLRARPDDIFDLSEHFGRAMAHELGWSAFPGFTQSARDRLLAYPWPGNVRELKNLVERAVYRWSTPDQPIDRLQFDPFASPYRPAAMLPEDVLKPSAPAPLQSEEKDEGQAVQKPLDLPYDYRQAVADHERILLHDALRRCKFNQRETAQKLGLSYDQLRHAAKKHGLL
ncbi:MULTISPECIES: phage shock protein operon transcriptional activator [unclassified Iodidimonas]|jgi:psp operon transcriptional activator|uniref:phage shock protein operon transcriptional activator n=1 Tax=unclassified Iodidimonas TaxID=2626145 RepID=UPI0024828978|nr:MULTISPECIES: phage shock protein operon transcriptional activator [unclassified Iodidimonas]